MIDVIESRIGMLYQAQIGSDLRISDRISRITNCRNVIVQPDPMHTSILQATKWNHV